MVAHHQNSVALCDSRHYVPLRLESDLARVQQLDRVVSVDWGVSWGAVGLVEFGGDRAHAELKVLPVAVVFRNDVSADTAVCMACYDHAAAVPAPCVPLLTCCECGHRIGNQSLCNAGDNIVICAADNVDDISHTQSPRNRILPCLSELHKQRY